LQPPVKEGGWQSIHHNKQKSQNILRGDYGLRHNHHKIDCQQILLRIDYKKYAKGHQNPLALITDWIFILFMRFTLCTFSFIQLKKIAVLVNLAQHAFGYYPANVRLVK
jgi:hypothetical protein